MKYADPYGNPLPKGVFFDPDRKRYRVRIYRHGEPVWCSYHHDYESAIRAHELALDAKAEHVANEHKIITADRYAAALSRA